MTFKKKFAATNPRTRLSGKVTACGRWDGRICGAHSTRFSLWDVPPPSQRQEPTLCGSRRRPGQLASKAAVATAVMAAAAAAAVVAAPLEKLWESSVETLGSFGGAFFKCDSLFGVLGVQSKIEKLDTKSMFFLEG